MQQQEQQVPLESLKAFRHQFESLVMLQHQPYLSQLALAFQIQAIVMLNVNYVLIEKHLKYLAAGQQDSFKKKEVTTPSSFDNGLSV